MKLRRITSLALAAAMALTLAACGSESISNASAESIVSAAPTESTVSTAPAEAATSQTASESTEQFRVGTECAYAPNNWQESEATDSNWPIENVAGAYAEGYDVQFAKVIAEGLGKDLVIVKMSWDGLISALNQGQIDAIIAGMMDTAERRESINFSDPLSRILQVPLCLVSRAPRWIL